jgi:hypothetical protein
MAILSRDAILSSNDLKKEVVSVPEWGGEVVIATMTGAARDSWEQSLLAGKKSVSLDNIRVRLVAATALDDKGNLLFSDKDAEALGKKSASALDRCVKVAQKLNRLTESELEDLSKN